MWKKPHILYLIIIYRQIIRFWGGLARLVRLEYSTHSAGQVITLFTQFRPDFFFLWSKGQVFIPTLGGQIIFLFTKTANSKCFHRNGFEMYIHVLIIIYTVCTCDTLFPTRILNSEISWFCFDFPKWGPVSFIITDFNVFVQFLE